MILHHELILPWQKNWLKPPTGAIEFKHFDRSFRCFWLYVLPIPFVVLAAFRYKNSDDALPSSIEFLLNCIVLSLILIGIVVELVRPRVWQLYLSSDGAILQTLFSQHRLSNTQLAAIKESKRYGLSLLIPVTGGHKHLSLIGMQKLTALRRRLDLYPEGDVKQSEQEFKSQFNIALVDMMHRLTLGALMISAFINDGSWPETFIQWTFFVWAIFMILDGLRSLYLSIGVKIKLSDDGLTINHHRSRSIAWKDVTKIKILDGDSYHHARLNIVTPKKTISIPESVINYWQLVKQVKARIPASAQVVDETS